MKFRGESISGNHQSRRTPVIVNQLRKSRSPINICRKRNAHNRNSGTAQAFDRHNQYDRNRVEGEMETHPPQASQRGFTKLH